MEGNDNYIKGNMMIKILCLFVRELNEEGRVGVILPIIKWKRKK